MIKVEQFPGGTLLTDAETLEGLMDGVADFIHSMFNNAAGIIPDLAPLCVPGYYSGNDYMSFAVGVSDVLEDIFADYNIKFLGTNYQGTGVFISTFAQIKAPGDLNGKSFRTSGTWLGRAMENWGAAAVTIPLPELTTALERNTIDGTYTGWVIAGPYALYEVADYVTYTSILESYAGLLMNLDTWNKLNDQQKAWVNEARDIFLKESYRLGQEAFDVYYNAMEDYGTNLYTLTAAEENAFTSLSRALYDEIAGNATDKGKALIAVLNGLS